MINFRQAVEFKCSKCTNTFTGFAVFAVQYDYVVRLRKPEIPSGWRIGRRVAGILTPPDRPTPSSDVDLFCPECELEDDS
jgi:purine nucleoside permease